MNALWLILLIPLFIILAALFIRVRFRIMAENDVKLILELPFFKTQLYPEKEKRPNPKKFTRKGLERQILKERKKQAKQNKRKAAKTAKKQAKATAPAQKQKKKMSVTEIIELVTLLAGKLLSSLSRRLRIDVKKLHVIVATGDAASTAITYGAASAAVAALTETLCLATHTSLPDTENGGVYADFTGSSSMVDIDIVLSMRVYGILATLLSLAYNYLKKQFLSNTKG